MFKRLIVLGSLVLSPVAVMGDTQGANQGDSFAVSVQAGQGNIVSIVVPANAVAQPPYALSGQTGTRPVHIESFTFGQSGPVMVDLGN